MKKIIVLFVAMCILAELCGCGTFNLSPIETRDPDVIEIEGPNADDVLAELHLLAQDIYFVDWSQIDSTTTRDDVKNGRFESITTQYVNTTDHMTGKKFTGFAPFFARSETFSFDQPWMTSAYPHISYYGDVVKFSIKATPHN